MDKDKLAQPEQRVHHELREIVEEACKLLAPMVLGQDKKLKMTNFAMTHIVKNNFPSLSSTEAHIVTTIIERLHREGRLHALLEK